MSVTGVLFGGCVMNGRWRESVGKLYWRFMFNLFVDLVVCLFSLETQAFYCKLLEDLNLRKPL